MSFPSNLAISPQLLAHKTETAADVGATLHIEPNDVPQAGETTLAWFALTRRGGETIPLEACDCSLSIYQQPDSILVQEPGLEPVSSEGYEQIPGAQITFPTVGAYELVLAGRPTEEGAFQPFELRFEVVVATGASAPETAESPVSNAPETNDEVPPASAPSSEARADPPQPVPAQSSPASPSSVPSFLLGSGLVLGVVFLVVLIAVWLWRNQNSKKV